MYRTMPSSQAPAIPGKARTVRARPRGSRRPSEPLDDAWNLLRRGEGGNHCVDLLAAYRDQADVRDEIRGESLKDGQRLRRDSHGLQILNCGAAATQLRSLLGPGDEGDCVACVGQAYRKDRALNPGAENHDLQCRAFFRDGAFRVSVRADGVACLGSALRDFGCSVAASGSALPLFE